LNDYDITRYNKTIGIWIDDPASDTDPLTDGSFLGTNPLDHVSAPPFNASSGTISSYYDLTSSADYFDGTDKDVFTMVDGGSDIPFSFTTWINMPSITSNKAVMSKYNDQTGNAYEYVLNLLSSGDALRVIIRQESTTGNVLVSSNESVPTNVWVRVGFTYDGRGGNDAQEGIDLYIDDKKCTIATSTSDVDYSNMENTASSFKLGRWNYSSGAGYLQGDISHAILWRDAELTQAEMNYEFERTAVKFGWLDGIDVNVAIGNEFLRENLVLASSYEYDFPADQSPNRYHGTNNGATHTIAATGDFSSYDFNGSSNIIDYGDEDDFSFGDSSTDSAFTVCAWANPDITTGDRGVIGKGSTSVESHLIRVLDGGKVRCLLFDDSLATHIRVDSSSSLSALEWANIAVTYDGSSSPSGITIYINGIDDTDRASEVDTGYTAMENLSQSLVVGRVASGSYFNGKIDDVRVYKNVEWTSDQVYTAYELSPHYAWNTQSSSSSSSS
jgi:hypothetical protein